MEETNLEKRQRTLAYWRNHDLMRTTQSMGIPQYCRAHDLSIAAFKFWRKYYKDHFPESEPMDEGGGVVEVYMEELTVPEQTLDIVIDERLAIRVSQNYNARFLLDLLNLLETHL